MAIHAPITGAAAGAIPSPAPSVSIGDTEPYRVALERALVDLEQLAAVADLVAEDVSHYAPVRAQLVMDAVVKLAEAARDRVAGAFS